MKVKTLDNTLEDGTKANITTCVNSDEEVIGFSLANDSSMKWEYVMQRHNGTEHHFDGPQAVGLYIERRSAAAMARALRSLADDLESEINDTKKV